MNKLDSLISKKEMLDATKRSRILELKKQKSRVSTSYEQLTINDRLYDEYYCYNADSAMKYVNENIEIATKENNDELLTRLKIKKSFLLAATGMLDEARMELADIHSNQLTHELRKDYFGQMIYIYGLLGNYTSLPPQKEGWNQYFDTEQLYKDSLQSILSPGDGGYLWYLGWSAQGLPKNQQDSIMKLLEREVDESDFDTREVAQIAYVLAILYREQENKDKFLEYMAKSAITDVTIGNREIASLHELAKSRFDDNDIDRAYSYVTYSLDAALNYPNRVRALTLLPLQNEINRAYQERNRQQEKQRHRLIVSLCILASVLAFAIIIIFIQLRILKRKNSLITDANTNLNRRNEELLGAQDELAKSNEMLKRLNLELQTTNYELREANLVKEEYVGSVFSICSLYIKKIEEIRRSINAKAIKKQWKEIEEMTSGYQNLSKNDLKEFYENFDSIFLHLFPDFIEDFNSLLNEEERMYPKDGELLNTELRIYALIRLGISDSVKIAEFLHCSPQTVYNYRFKTRAKAKGSKETFAEQVKNIGRISQ